MLMNYWIHYLITKKSKMLFSNFQGQILPDTRFGNIIIQMVKEKKPSKILEIGTWKGLGSTKCFIDGIMEVKNEDPSYNPSFISLETNKRFFDIASENLKNFKDHVTLKFGRIIDKENYVKYVDTLNLKNDPLLGVENPFDWHINDLRDYKNCDNISEEIIQDYDMILLDGGEFATYLEWELLKDKFKIILLDDTKVDKTSKILYECENDNTLNCIIKRQ